ncbi:ABC transporter permease [Tetragenococcus solitarius]|uniref:ABC transporter permease n=1 Tax=Tetragenococcus solitarius TaxID=71453 RepID=A0ABP6KPZ5_9ENTE|nr:tetronasin resistance protein [Tetragenococcus solitarius]
MNEKIARWHLLFIQYCKRDWAKIIFWLFGLGLFSGGFVPAFEEIAKGQGLVGMFETMKNPAMISIVGPTPIEKAVDYTISAMYAHEMLLFCSLFAMIISTLHVISHTRKEEEQGLSEMVRSFQVGRQANSLAVIVETFVINLLLAFFISGFIMLFNVQSFDLEGALLFASAISLSGMLGAMLALVFAQLMSTSSGAVGSTLGFIGLLYILRAGSDVSNLDLSTLNPMGWTYLTYPFTENHWLPLLYSAILSVALFFFASFLENRRDMGTGYFPERGGKPEAKRTLLSIHGLLFRISRTTIISWLLACFILGATYGSIYGDMGVFLSSNELVEQMFSQEGSSIEASFTATIMSILVLLTTILPISLINKLFTEETSSRFSQIFSTKVSRTRLFMTTVCLAVVAGMVGVFLVSTGLGTAAIAATTGDFELQFNDFLAAGYNLFPALLFFVGIASVFLGWLPQLNKIVYVYLVYTFVLNYFKDILDLPEWINKTAIFNWPAEIPIESFDVTIFAVISVISLILIVIGWLGYRRRDLVENN